MIYLTGDCHGNFHRFSKRVRRRLPFPLTEEDFVIVCGDLGLLWAEDDTLQYNLDWFSRLPFTLLWVQGNHENYQMIAGYPQESWKGGKVRHILRDKVILLERGQIFTLEGRTFFTFGGAASHDVSGGILDLDSPTYREERVRAMRSGLPYRIRNISWWEQELPDEQELEEGRRNLANAGWRVDTVISHCGSSQVQEKVNYYYRLHGYRSELYKPDILTAYFEELEGKLQYQRWFMGHYHMDLRLDEKHWILYHSILPLDGNLEEGRDCNV